MKDISVELKVGIFAIIVIMALTYMTFKVGSLPMIWEKGYRLYVTLDDTSGLDEKSRIKIAGVEAGMIDRINLVEGKAKVTILLKPDVKVYKDAEVSLRMSGLLGDRHLALATGSPEQPLLKNGDTILNVKPATDIDMLVSRLTDAAGNIGDLTSNINGIFGKEERKAIREAMYNLRDVTSSLKDISEQNKVPLNNIIARIDTFTKSMDKKGPVLIDDLTSAANELKTIIQENRGSFRDSMENIKGFSSSAGVIAKRLEKGEGTLGKLLQEDELYNSLNKVSTEAGKSMEVVGRLRTFMDFHAEYNSEDKESKGFFELTLQPRDDKYYILGITTDPMGSVETIETTTNGILVREEKLQSKVEFTAQYARRFNDIAMRIGLMENTFGAGADYFFNNDAGRVKFDIWDMNADEARASEPHARLGVDYRVFRFLFVSGGADNLLNSRRRGVYVGAGLKFEDEDLKYIIGKLPGVSLK
ncbi:MAG TPA: MCE family protein [Nitrospirae bacterium]|nr:putative phospholipid ABC transporter-binding protein MlaD [bacterium BMS3Abin09]GBE40680.1 putative phospholipid ABC transporter-binding protein MlaD [bacterium BMS3Bbin09]HDO66621.1 MCE family protein [Nitrospirota bacterium]HDZ83969.1 MCE family protein [Nitrospirota bacterium]HEW80795.1 MCE family protein [Nitrospirota bacterium]